MNESKPQGFRCGFVSIVGRPNVGKSTLLNAIVGEKVAIVSSVPQTTRHQIRGMYNDERGQIIFIDTPGLHLGKDRLDSFMNQCSTGALKEVDCIIHLVDTSRHIGPEEENVVNCLKEVHTPIILGLNKVDLKGACIPEYISLWEKVKGKKIQEMGNITMIALSGKTGINKRELMALIFERLPEGPALYPPDIISDMPQKLALADIIREKLLYVLKEELPHSLAVVVEKMEKRKDCTYIHAVILVERESQKEIVIGRKGSVLKKIGMEAREEIEELLESKVFLETFVKVQNNWRDDHSILQELGYE